ncbi:hypothetical protein FBZ84_101214 [Azospirillum baldaniorum]|uniref:hypothetical protein n=1 Tax=Azospirillum baldaniorum TaxID=1064539 RepID=UPI0011A4964A|nr:hypothetical protein [Azospirillum baldaniorum]TWA71947.1 hypothetical protein FBZ84_101214 [Azospirillum baldaniorum]
MADKPMFVPLATNPYRWFEQGLKRWELRRVGGQWQPKHCVYGRPATLSRGYSTPDRMPAMVGIYAVFDTMEEAMTVVDYRLIIPTAGSLRDAVKVATEILGDKPGPFIAVEFLTGQP